MNILIISEEYPFDRDWIYTKFVKSYQTEKIFLGKDTGTSYYSDSGTSTKYVKDSIGNTILLQIEKNKYVFIEGTIYEFSNKEEIIKYFSLIGRNDTPYPIALGENNVYFMLDKFYISRDYFPKKLDIKHFEAAYFLLLKIEEKNIVKNKFKNYKKIDFFEN